MRSVNVLYLLLILLISMQWNTKVDLIFGEYKLLRNFS